METQTSDVTTPTPEALLGMLGKLKRTLTQNLSEQKRTSDVQDYIAASNVRSGVRDNVPNLLRPSPGLDILSQDKMALSIDQSVNRPRSPVPTALKLESSAPPMDLDRPQGALATPLDLSQRPPVLNEAAPIASNASAMAEPAPSSEASTGRDALSFGLKTAVATKPEAVNQSAVASDAELALKPDRAQSAEGEPAAETTEAEPAVAAESNALRTESAAGNPLTTLDKPVQLRTDDRSQGLVLPLQNSTSGVAVHAPGVVADKLAVASAPAGDEPTEGQAKGNDGQGERQEGKGGGSDAGRGHKEATEEVLPSTEEDLDAAMQELAHEVSQLKPEGQAAAAGEGSTGQGSYLHRHTSSLILKMSQDAAVPPLPAVAHLGPSTRSHATSLTVTPGTTIKPGVARKTIKSMAASLFRAFDEGKLRERGPALARQQGTVGSQPAEQLLKATIRTYKSSPKRREAAPDTVQQSVSPARTVSYSLQKASLRRSLSPNIGRQTPLRQPEWDSSKPARPSPQRAQRASADLDPAMTSVLRFNSLSSPQHAQHAAYAPEFQTCRLEEGQHAQHAASGTNQPCTSREDLTTSRSGVPQIGGSAQPVSLSQTPQSPPVGSSAAFPSASGNTIIASARSSSVPKNATRTQAGLRSCGRGQTSPTPSPPRFRHLPSNNLADRPAWASTTASRGATPSHPRGVTPLRRTTGSTTVAATPKGLTLTPPPHPATVPAPLQGAGSHQHMTDIDDRVGRRVASSDPQATTVDVTVEPGQGSSDTHADYLVDSEAHAHAQALQQLQQAVEEYNSSSPNVLVPTAVELAAALRHAAKGPAPSKPSLEALQLPALRVSHQAGDGDSPSHSVPATPWPQWVRGAWGSPQAEGRGEAEGCASGPVAGKDLAPAGAKRGKEKPQRAQRDPRAGGAEPCNNGWSPVKRPESSAGRRSALVRRALAEAEAAAGKGPASQVKPKGSSWRARAAAVRPRSSATPPRGVPRRSRVSATPPRPSTHSSGAVQQAEALQHKSKPHVSLNQAGAVVKPPSLRDGQAAASHNPTGQPNLGTLQPLKGRPLSVVKGSQPAPPRAEPPSRAGAGSVQSQQRENALQAFGLNVSAQHANVAQADRSPRHAAKFWAPEDTEQPQHSMHAEATPAASPPSSNTALHQPSHAEHVVLSNSKEQAPAGVAPLHSVTSVAALRLSFEQMGSSGVASVKPRNRLPLRKVSSKAQVHIDDGSPQQAALLWQHSLRGADIMDAVEHAEHAEPDQAVQQGEVQSKPAVGPSTNALPLYHTMSALVAQRLPLRAVTHQGPASGVADADSPAPSGLEQGQMGSARLTEAVLAAAENVRSSAKRLPVSHRLPVSRSIFGSDEGSLVSSDDQHDIHTKGSSPQDASMQPLIEEATLALLPDRGMSPVSESTEEHAPSASGHAHQPDSAAHRRLPAQHARQLQHASRSNQVNRDEVYPWSSLSWAFSPSWIRVICQLCPSPPPHFATPLLPHTLQTSLGIHAKDTRTYTFDQVLASDSSPQELGEQAAGVIQAVLQGRNSVVVAMGQPASAKSHTLLGHDPTDPQASSSSPGVSAMLVETLFSEMKQRRLPAEVHSVYVTAFQIVNESIQDLVQTQHPGAGAHQPHLKGGANRHDVFVDKQKRTWVSNLAAVRISSPADFQQMLDLVSSHRSASSSGLSHMSDDSSTCVVTLLVTADIPTDPNPLSVRQKPPSSAASRPQPPSVHPPEAQARPSTRLCTKLTFVEIGNSTVPVQASPVRSVSAGQGVFAHHQLARSSTGMSVTSTWGRRNTSEDRPQGSFLRSGGGRGFAARGRQDKSQESTVRSVSEVVWAAAHGKGMPVPHRACKLTRYLQDTLCPSGRAVAIVCINPSAEFQMSSIPALTAAERMMPV